MAAAVASKALQVSRPLAAMAPPAVAQRGCPELSARLAAAAVRQWGRAPPMDSGQLHARFHPYIADMRPRVATTLLDLIPNRGGA